MRILVVTISFLAFLSFCDANAQISIEQPPSGTLSQEQLAVIAEDIQKVLENPLAEDADEGRQLLWDWITGSPDVTVTVCHTVIGGVAQSETEHKDLYIILSVLSGAAYLIHNPDADLLDEQVGGLKGMLIAYEQVKITLGEDAKDSTMEALTRIKDSGELRSAVQSVMGGCQRES